MPNDITESAAPDSIVVDDSPFNFGESETLPPHENWDALYDERDETPFALAIDTGGEG